MRITSLDFTEGDWCSDLQGWRGWSGVEVDEPRRDGSEDRVVGEYRNPGGSNPDTGRLDGEHEGTGVRRTVSNKEDVTRWTVDSSFLWTPGR